MHPLLSWSSGNEWEADLEVGGSNPGEYKAKPAVNQYSGLMGIWGKG